MKCVQIHKDGTMDDLDISLKKLKTLINLKNCCKIIVKSAKSQGNNSLQELYKWSYEGTSIHCYGWWDGEAGFENKHELPPGGKSNFLEEDSSVKLLFGDILAVTVDDLLIIWIGGALILLVLKLIWKPLFASTVNYELAEAEGLNPDRAKAIFTILMAAIIAISIKMVGLLLITGMLIIPAAMARNISSSPQRMIIYSIVGGLLSVILGLFSSLEFNTASGPSIIAASLFLFILSLLKIKQSIKLKN